MNRATVLTDKFDRALLYATHIHGGQVRKSNSIPYVAHLLAVAATVLEYGGDEDLAIAALLHDSVEDQGGKARLEDVRNRFGERVARIVQACSDSLADTAKQRSSAAARHAIVEDGSEEDGALPQPSFVYWAAHLGCTATNSRTATNSSVRGIVAVARCHIDNAIYERTVSGINLLFG
jgi:hypothetical protein